MTITDPSIQQPPEGQEPQGLPVPPVTEAVDPPDGTTGTGEPPKGDAHKHTVPTKTFTAEDIEKARKEEKDKLYKSIEDMKGQLALVTKEREDREKAAKEAEKAAAAAAKAKADEEKSAKELLAEKEQEWNQKFAQIEADRQRSDALLDQERKFASLMDYRTKRIAEESENIMPELIDYVTGMSEEDIDKAIADAKEKTARIVGNIQQATQQARQQQRGPSVTSPPVGPLEQNSEGYETLTADDIRGMDMATYAKRREQLLGAASKNRQRGLFG